MTLLEKFKLDHPDAPMNNNGEPKCCPYHLGYVNTTGCPNVDVESGCIACWNREYKGETLNDMRKTHGLEEIPTKTTVTIEFDSFNFNNFALAGKIFEICQNDNIHYLDAQTVARMLEAEVHNERRKKDDVQRKIGYGAS